MVTWQPRPHQSACHRRCRPAVGAVGHHDAGATGTRMIPTVRYPTDDLTESDELRLGARQLATVITIVIASLRDAALTHAAGPPTTSDDAAGAAKSKFCGQRTRIQLIQAQLVSVVSVQFSNRHCHYPSCT